MRKLKLTLLFTALLTLTACNITDLFGGKSSENNNDQPSSSIKKELPVTERYINDEAIVLPDTKLEFRYEYVITGSTDGNNWYVDVYVTVTNLTSAQKRYNFENPLVVRESDNQEFEVTTKQATNPLIDPNYAHEIDFVSHVPESLRDHHYFFIFDFNDQATYKIHLYDRPTA